MSIPIPSSSRRWPTGLSSSLALAVVLAASPLRAGDLVAARMFVTSTAGNGDFGTNGSWAETEGSLLTGVEAADEICAIRAEAGGLAVAGFPVFRAWIAVAGTDPYCHLQGLTGTKSDSCNSQDTLPSGGWYRTDGVPFAESLLDIDTGVLASASRNEAGTFVSSIAWTGTNADGAVTGSTCSGWESTSGFGSFGSTTSEKFWRGLVSAATGCGSDQRLYCFQYPPVVTPRRAWPEPAALVFVKSGGGPGNLGGIGGADVTCQDQAEAAGLPGAESFRAWLSDDTTDAKDRFTITGPWYRVDGVRVAASLAALIDGNLDSGISRLANGSILSAPDRAWTGTSGGGTKLANNCNDWFSIDSGVEGTPGSTDETGNSWTATGDFSAACNNAGRFYCFGDTIVIFWDRFETGDVARWSSSTGLAP